MTVHPAPSPRSSCRRFTPRKAASPAAISVERSPSAGGGDDAERVLHVVRARHGSSTPAELSRPAAHQVEPRPVRPSSSDARLPVGAGRSTE